MRFFAYDDGLWRDVLRDAWEGREEVELSRRGGEVEVIAAAVLPADIVAPAARSPTTG
jgi:hypothetical protein